MVFQGCVRQSLGAVEGDAKVVVHDGIAEVQLDAVVSHACGEHNVDAEQRN